MKRLLMACMTICTLSGFAQTVTNSNTRNNAPVIVADTVPVRLMDQKMNAEPKADSKARKKTQVELNREQELNITAPASEMDADGAVPSATIRMEQQFKTNQLNATHQYTRRSASPDEQMSMDQSVKFYQSQSPQSFESHFYAYLAGHHNWKLYPELQLAAALEPENPDVIRQLAAYHIMTGEAENAISEIELLIAKEELTTEQLAYANDLLVSGMENAVIVLHGFADMLTAYYVQQKQDIRNDVRLVSLDLLQSSDYRNEWMKSDQLRFPASSQIDTTYLRQFCEMNPEHNIQLSLTIPKDYFVPVKTKLYPVGLTFLYSEVPVEYFERNKQLWYEQLEKEPLLEYELGAFGANAPAMEKKKEAIKINESRLSNNYLPMMVTLKTQLEKAGEKKKAEELERQIRLLKPY